jgi:type VI secretion system protein ImpL
MKLLIKLLKNRSLVIAIVFLLLMTMVMVAGYYFHWPWEWRIVGVVSVLFLWIIVVLFERLRAVKSAMNLEESIKAQVDKNVQGMRPDKLEEIEQLKERLYKAIDALKKSKLRKGVNAKAALYALPWYMFIGPPGSGKTTAIENSGLEFPFSNERIRGIGGTRNCDWFFSNSAILLDTAGRYTTEPEDREEWYAFLDILKKNRKEKPINGVIVGVSIADLLNVAPDDVERHAGIIRSRIDELTERLGVRFPVYLVFTKCDLIQGFVDFFGEYGRSEREQVWGTTLRKNQMTDPDPGHVFEKEFLELYQSLISLRLQRLSAPMKRDERRNVYTFPLEFLSARSNLSLFVGKLFHPNPYQENPVFRGFYFSSGTQEGVPIDRVIQAIAKEIGLSPEAVKSFDPEMEKKCYFIKQLFTDIIIPDQHLSELTSHTARRRGLIKLASVTVIIMLMILFTVGTLSMHVRFKGDTGRLQSVARKVEQIRWADDTLLEDFYTLDEYRKTIVHLERPPVLGAGIYRGSALRIPSRQLYYEKTYPFVADYLVHGLLTDRLNDYITGRDDIHRDQAYTYLCTYLLLGDKYDLLRLSKSEKVFLKTEMIALTDNLLERRFRLTSQHQDAGQVRAVTELMKNQIAFFIDILAEHDVITPKPGRIGGFDTNVQLVSRVRNRLGAPNIQDVYSGIKREAIAQPEYVTLHEILDNRHVDLFISTASVSRMYTQEVWKSVIRDEIRSASRNPGQDDWVIGIEAAQLPAEMRDEKIMEERLQELYFREYSNAWWDFLKNIEVERFNDIGTAVRRLKILGDAQESPVRRIIESVTSETSFGTLMTQAAGQATGRAGLEGPVHPVEREFRAVHALSSDERGDLVATLSQFELLAGTLEMLINDPPEKTAEFAAQVIQQRSGDIPEALRAIRGTMAGLDLTFRRNLFEKTVLNAWASVLDRTQNYLNTRWKQTVYDMYTTTLSAHYPFNRGSSTETTIVDVERFFQGSNGLFWSFYNRELQPFVRTDTWTPNTWEGMGITLSERTRSAFNRASEITRGLGLQTETNIRIPFSLFADLPSPTGVLDQITLTVDGSEIIYRMGRPRWEDIAWPLYEGLSATYLELQTSREVIRPLSFEGRWSFFRLLDEARIREESPTDFAVQWSVPIGLDGQIILHYKLRARSVHNPFGKPDFYTLLIPQTLN